MMLRFAFFVLVWLMANVIASSAFVWSWERHPRQHHHQHRHFVSHRHYSSQINRRQPEAVVIPNRDRRVIDRSCQETRDSIRLTQAERFADYLANLPDEQRQSVLRCFGGHGQQ